MASPCLSQSSSPSKKSCICSFGSFGGADDGSAGASRMTLFSVDISKSDLCRAEQCKLAFALLRRGYAPGLEYL